MHFFSHKKLKKIVPRRGTDNDTEEKEPNHPELRKKIELPKPTDDNNIIKVEIYDKKDKMNQI